MLSTEARKSAAIVLVVDSASIGSEVNLVSEVTIDTATVKTNLFLNLAVCIFVDVCGCISLYLCLYLYLYLYIHIYIYIDACVYMSVCKFLSFLF